MPDSKDHHHAARGPITPVNINWPAYEKDTKVKVFEWFDHVWSLIDSGRVDSLRPAPFYERRELLTDEIVDKVAETLEAYLHEEITKYPGYHGGAQKIQPGETLITPGFDTLPPLAKRALVERYDELLQAVRIPDNVPTVASYAAGEGWD